LAAVGEAMAAHAKRSDQACAARCPAVAYLQAERAVDPAKQQAARACASLDAAQQCRRAVWPVVNRSATAVAIGLCSSLRADAVPSSRWR